MSTKLMKKWSTLVVTRKMPTKTTMRFHVVSTSMAIIKETLTGVDKDMQKLEPLYIAGETKMMQPLWQFLKT